MRSGGAHDWRSPRVKHPCRPGTRVALVLPTHQGKECHVRDQLRDMIETARRSGDRIGVDGRTETSATLGAELIRLARLATSIHLAEAARTPAPVPVTDDAAGGDRTLLAREGVR